MATPRTISSLTDATDNGWTVNGSGTNWYAELKLNVQCGGKLCAVAASSSDLPAAIQSVENNQAYWDSGNSARDTTFSGVVV